MPQECFSCCVLLLKWLHLQLRFFFPILCAFSGVLCSSNTITDKPLRLLEITALLTRAPVGPCSWCPHMSSFFSAVPRNTAWRAAEQWWKWEQEKSCWTPNLTLWGLNGRTGSVCATAEAGCECWEVKWEQVGGRQRTTSSENMRGCPEELTQGRALGSLSRPCPLQERAVPGYSLSTVAGNWGQKHFRESDVLIFLWLLEWTLCYPVV